MSLRVAEHAMLSRYVLHQKLSGSLKAGFLDDVMFTPGHRVYQATGQA